MSSLPSSIPSTNTKRWASLADRLNPNRPSFDAQLKANWKTMSKKQRKQIIKEDKIAIAALKSRGTSQPLPFTAEEDDHCETSPGKSVYLVISILWFHVFNMKSW